VIRERAYFAFKCILGASMNDFRVRAVRSFSEGQSVVLLSGCNGKRKASRFANASAIDGIRIRRHMGRELHATTKSARGRG
jgi:hypothetical protein